MDTIGEIDLRGKTLVSSTDVAALLAVTGDVPELLIEICRRFGYRRTLEIEMSDYDVIKDEIEKLVRESA